MKLNILLLCNKPDVGNDANTIIDHIESLERYSSNDIWVYSNWGNISSSLDLDRFDVIVIHYSLSLLHNKYLSKEAKKRIKNYKGLKVVFVQDEYRQINYLISQLHLLEVDVLFTCFEPSEMVKIYNKAKLPNTSLYTNLTGYIPERLLALNHLSPIKDRQLHIGYRGRKLPYWYGELGYEKWSIVDKWKKSVADFGISMDLSYEERDRIYGGGWLDFISSCKATLGVESGASVMDFTGELERQVDLHQLLHPTDDFYKVQQLYLKEYEGLYKLNQISPRCFEAIALKTVLILYEGAYSDILQPWRHYIPLKKDFSNISEVVSKLKDDDYLQNMADVAYQEIAINYQYSYRHFIDYFDGVIFNEFNLRNKELKGIPYSDKEFNKFVIRNNLSRKIYYFFYKFYLKSPSKVQLLLKSIARPNNLFKINKKGARV